MSVIDISPPLREPMPVYPGNPGYARRVVRDVREGAHSTLSEITTGTHAGTHVDAPGHFIPGAPMLDDVPLEALVGAARVVDVAATGAIPAAEIEALEPREGERLLLKTRNSALWQRVDFEPGFVFLSTEAAKLLAERRIACLGVDYLSVGGFQSNGTEVHRALLEAGIAIIEGLDLSAAQPGRYELVCLPLRLQGAEAAPARAILLPPRG